MPGEVNSRNYVIAFAFLALALAAGVTVLLVTRPETVEIVVNTPAPTPTSPPSATPGPMQVYVTGAVAEPQTTVELPQGSRVADAVDAAGGLTDEADLDRYNPAALLRDGDQVHVFAIDESQEEVAAPTATGSELVNINTATLDELDALPRIGPALAQTIIEWRDENGPFTSLEDLDAVPGIGPAVLDDLRDLIVFE
jgi:competence protein ComEA